MKKSMKEFVILIADKDEGIRLSLSDICKDEGYTVLTASSYDEMMTALKLQTPNLVLLDSQLSGIDGVSILKDIKSFNRDIPVIMFIESGTLDFAVQATRVGVYDLLQKPLSLERVLLVIKMALKEDVQKPLNQQDIEKTTEEVGFFLSLIDENTNNILHKLSLKAEYTSHNEDLQTFLCCLEEDTEEIKKAVIAIRDRVNKIA